MDTTRRELPALKEAKDPGDQCCSEHWVGASFGIMVFSGICPEVELLDHLFVDHLHVFFGEMSI